MLSVRPHILASLEFTKLEGQVIVGTFTFTSRTAEKTCEHPSPGQMGLTRYQRVAVKGQVLKPGLVLPGMSLQGPPAP